MRRPKPSVPPDLISLILEKSGFSRKIIEHLNGDYAATQIRLLFQQIVAAIIA
jgi:hypothetical protein